MTFMFSHSLCTRGGWVGFAFFRTPCLKFARPPCSPFFHHMWWIFSPECRYAMYPFFFPECRYAFHPFSFLYAGILFTLFHPSERWMAVWLQFSSGKKHCIPMLLFVVFRVFSCPHVYLFTCAVWLFSNVRCLRCDCVTHFRLWHVFRLLTMGSVLYVFTSYYGVAPILLDPCFLCVRK